nr:Predicted membrane protein [Streptococcus thermophilus]
MSSQIEPSTDQPVTRPAPGPAGVRPIWDGQKETLPPPQDGPSPEVLGPSKLRWSSDRAFGPSGNPKRIIGIDVARGFALLGMIAVHILPAYSPYTGRPTVVWQLLAGNAAALFALLAGISVALITGANNPYDGRRMRRSRVSLVIRALLILLLGLAISELPLHVYNILPYYGLMFLAAVLFSGMRIRNLLISAGAFIVFGPLTVYLVNSYVDYREPTNPNFTSMFTMPGDTFLTLLAGGTYPVVTWMTYICVGIALGRMNLRWLLTEARLMLWGLVLIAISSITSWFLIDYAGGFEALYYHTDGYEAEDILDTIDYGPSDRLPTDTLWWLAIDGPHTNTPFSLVKSLGFAMLFLGLTLVVSQALKHVLLPLIAAGSMTLTIYVAHLLSFAYFGDSIDVFSTQWFLGQVIFFLIFASFWHLAFGQGPLERIISKICKGVSKKLVPVEAPAYEEASTAATAVTAETPQTQTDAEQSNPRD